LLDFGDRKRVRPSLKSLFFSVVVCLAALYLTLFLGPFGSGAYVPVLIAAVIALGVSLLRLRGLLAGLPPPYGRGKVTRIDSRRTARDGVLLILGSAFLIVALFGSVLVVKPSEFFFPAIFGLMLGFPLSVAVFFGFTAGLESRTKSRIFSVAAETKEGGKAVLVKSVELRPARKDSRPPGAE
jgi:hypothetical protein